MGDRPENVHREHTLTGGEIPLTERLVGCARNLSRVNTICAQRHGRHSPNTRLRNKEL